MNKQTVMMLAIGATAAYWWFTRTDLKIDSIDNVSKTLNFTFNRKEYSYQWGTGDGIVFNRGLFTVSVEEKPGMIVFTVRRGSKIIMNQTVPIT